MSKYPKVNYIGNKEKLAEWIIEKLPISDGFVLDLFCGGCSVSYALKNRGFGVISNDALFSNYVIAKALIENDNEVLCESDFDISVDNVECEEKYDEIKFLTNKLYFKEEVEELARLIKISEKINGYKKYLFLALLRRAMIRKIPYSRMNISWSEIKKLRDEEYSYKKYGRYRHYHNLSFEYHIRENLQQYNNAIINSNDKCIALNSDAKDCLLNLNMAVDVIYMDPPYPSTMNKYEDFYGCFDQMFGEKACFKTDLTNKDTFLNSFSELIKLCIGKTKYVVISLNNNCFPSVELLVQQIYPFVDEYCTYTQQHVYKVTGKEQKKSNIEVLLVCKIKEKL